MGPKAELSLFIVLAILLGCLFLFLFFYPLIRNFFYSHKTIQSYYKKVYRVALDNDFYLINNFENKTAEEEEFHIDHILIGDKFIYCIRDRYFPGAIIGKEEDPAWILCRRKKSEKIKNPLYVNAIRVQRLALMSGIDRKCFISVVLVNDDCLITPYEVSSQDNFLVSLSNFPKFIKEKESMPIDPLDPQAIAVAARDFSELNLSEKRKKKDK